MTNEELLQKARNDYPVGTAYKCAYSDDSTYTVDTTESFSISSYGDIWGNIVTGKQIGRAHV